MEAAAAAVRRHLCAASMPQPWVSMRITTGSARRSLNRKFPTSLRPVAIHSLASPWYQGPKKKRARPLCKYESEALGTSCLHETQGTAHNCARPAIQCRLLPQPSTRIPATREASQRRAYSTKGTLPRCSISRVAKLTAARG